MLKHSAFLSFGTALFLCATLVACGGGGGGGGGTGMPPPQPSPSPSPLPSGSAHPAANLDLFNFTGTSAQQFKQFAPTPTPPVTTINAVVTRNENVKTNQTFHGIASTDFQATEVDTAPHQAITTNSDNYFVIPAGAGNVLNIGFHSTDSNGVIMDVQNLAGNGIVDEVPEVSGANWANNAAQTINETDPDGTVTTENIAADGSYNFTSSNSGFGNTTASENSNGSGTLTVPTIGFFGVGTGTTFTVGTPSPSTITITLSAAGAPNPTPAPIPLTFNTWYSQNPVLATDQTTNQGQRNMPAGCAAAQFGTTGNQLHEVRTRLDTVFGTNETITTDTWIVPSVGPACIKVNDSFNGYYDFAGQTGFFTVGASPLQTTTFAEIIGLQSETLFGSSRHPLISARVSSSQLAAQYAGLQERLESFRHFVRMRMLRHLLQKRGTQL